MVWDQHKIPGPKERISIGTTTPIIRVGIIRSGTHKKASRARFTRKSRLSSGRKNSSLEPSCRRDRIKCTLPLGSVSSDELRKGAIPAIIACQRAGSDSASVSKREPAVEQHSPEQMADETALKLEPRRPRYL